MGLVEDLDAGIHQLGADRDRHRRAGDAGDDREKQVHRADVLVIRRIDPAPPARRMVVRVLVMGMIVSSCACGHFEILPCSPLSDLLGPEALVPSRFTAYSAGRAPSACANVSVFALANFFFAASTQVENSWSVTTFTAIGM